MLVVYAMSGSAFALLAAVCFAASRIPLRRGLLQAGESFSGLAYSIFIGVILFSLLAFIPGDRAELTTLSWRSYVLLGAAGIAHFIAGRGLMYSSVRFVGNNIAAPLARSNILIAVVGGVILLGETLTFWAILGILLIATGAILVSLSGGENEIGITRGDLIKGIIAGLGAGLFWGVSSVLVRSGIQEVNSPFVAAFISYSAAFVVIAGSLLSKQRRLQLTQLDRSSLVLLLLSGLFVGLAQLLRYVSLDLSPASIVQPLMSTSLLIVVFFGFFVNRKLEVFTWKVILGSIVVAAGAVLIF